MAAIVAGAVIASVAGIVVGGIKDTVVDEPRRRAERQAISDYQDDVDAQVAEHNRLQKAEVDRVHAAQQDLANRTADIQRRDAARQQGHYGQLADDFLREAHGARAQQVTAYSRSGALVQGSALHRLGQTTSRGEEGARRYRAHGNEAVRRGHSIADITERSAIRPAFVPASRAIRQPYIPSSQFNPLGAALTGLQTGFQLFGGSDYLADAFASRSASRSSGGSGGGRGLQFEY